MSGSITGTPFVISPIQAANTFSQAGGLPRQRNVFIVRFLPNVNSQGNFTTLTFAAKSIDRPRVNPKTEELSQYNKKRQVYTGFKLEPVRIQFYDSADGSAQNMWTQYGRYYFGDLNPQMAQGSTSNMSSYAYDVTTNSWFDVNNTGFGFTARNGGATDNNAQFFFDRIEIYHFYDGQFDLYYLVHPKISSFQPDDLDYQNSEISTISAEIVYENLQYFPQNPVSGTQFEEFSQQFYGGALPVPTAGSPTLGANTTGLSTTSPSNPSIGSLLSNLTNQSFTNPNNIQAYRYNDPSGATIGGFGNFVFGPTIASSNNQNLSTMTLGNPALAAALSIGAANNPMASSTPVMFNVLTSATRGIDGATYDAMNAQSEAANSGYGTGGDIVTTALLSARAINGSGIAVNTSGQITLSAAGYGSINAQMTGTAQYGYNVQTDQEGNSWGFTGPEGFLGPIGPQNPGPYSPDQPAGIDGRFTPPAPLASPTVGGSST